MITVNTLKNFTLKNFKMQPVDEFLCILFDNTEYRYSNDAHAKKGLKVVDVLNDKDELEYEIWLVEEDGDYLFKKTYFQVILDQDYDAAYVASRKTFDKKDHEHITKNMNELYTIEYEDVDLERLIARRPEILSNILKNYKSLINEKIEFYEAKQKRMRQSYAFLRKLEQYL